GRVGERAEFVHGVNSAEFGGLGETQDTGLGIVDVLALVDDGVNGRRINFGVSAREQENFGAVGKKFGRAALGGFEMREFVAEDTVIRLAERGEREGIGGGAVEDKKDLAFGFEHVAHQVGGFGSPGIIAVAGFMA